jgi:hypothetical protein
MKNSTLNIMDGMEDRLYEKMTENIKICVKESLIENQVISIFVLNIRVITRM